MKKILLFAALTLLVPIVSFSQPKNSLLHYLPEKVTAKGTLVIEGGGDRISVILKTIIKYGGGDNAKLLVVPFASGIADTTGMNQSKEFRNLGCKHVQSHKTGRDSVVNVKEFRSKVVTVDSIRIPYGYLIPKSNLKLCGWVARQNFKIAQLSGREERMYEISKINGEEKVDFEDDIISLPRTSTAKLSWSEFAAKYGSDVLEKYIFIPAGQLKCKLLVVGLEPTSELGLSTYTEFEDLVKQGEEYPVIRVR